MSTLANAPPVRHGKCRLTLTIDDTHYRLTRATGSTRGTKIWRLKSIDGPRAGQCYTVLTVSGQITCTCPDSTRNQAVCKHQRALQSCGLVNRRCIPSAIVVARNLATVPPSLEGGSHV